MESLGYKGQTIQEETESIEYSVELPDRLY
jgi:hypothetical protein